MRAAPGNGLSAVPAARETFYEMGPFDDLFLGFSGIEVVGEEQLG